MKIQIESDLISTSKETVNQFNFIIKTVLAFKTLDELKNWAENTHTNKNLFRFGFGANHCWVNEFYSYGTLSENRLLLIVE